MRPKTDTPRWIAAILSLPGSGQARAGFGLPIGGFRSSSISRGRRGAGAFWPQPAGSGPLAIVVELGGSALVILDAGSGWGPAVSAC